jgi:hypothetical protein
VRAASSGRRVLFAGLRQPMDNLRRRYHTLRQMRIERAGGDIFGSAEYLLREFLGFQLAMNVSVVREKARLAGRNFLGSNETYQVIFGFLAMQMFSRGNEPALSFRSPPATRHRVALRYWTVISVACSSQRTHGAALFEASQDRPLVNVFAQSKPKACRGSRLGQQDGARGLGRHEQTGHLPTRRSASMNC